VTAARLVRAIVALANGHTFDPLQVAAVDTAR
jgi:hypothetical protein